MVASSTQPALPRCGCGRVRGSAFCRCGRAFSAIAPLALGAGAAIVICRRSRRAPAGWVAQCGFGSQQQALAWAQAAGSLFHVARPVVRRCGAAWLVSVPVLAGPFQVVTREG